MTDPDQNKPKPVKAMQARFAEIVAARPSDSHAGGDRCAEPSATKVGQFGQSPADLPPGAMFI